MICDNESTSRDWAWQRMYCISSGHYYLNGQLENTGSLYMARCQAICPKMPQKFRAERKDYCLEQTGEASGRESLGSGAKGLSIWELAGRQVSGLGMRC